MYIWINIDPPGDFSKLAAEIPDMYNPDRVIAFLQSGLSKDVYGVLLETGYIDKDYRSTYYGFYAKKGARFDPFCLRLHFFKKGLSLTNDLELRAVDGEIEKYYIGFMVLRPTPITPVGRTILSIHARLGVDGAIIQAPHHVHILGYRLVISGFPFMQQHTDISVCAHAACWSILRHYSQRHHNYAEISVGDITLLASSTNPGGLIPSRGLRVEQACRIFSQAQLYPDVYSDEDFKKDGNFHRILNAYVESGFPIFAAVHAKQHAITVIGHGKPDRDALDKLDAPLYSWDAINSFIVIDDNHMPYLTINSLDKDPYSVKDIDTFVVPLPDKIYFPAEAVEIQVSNLLENGFPQLDWSYFEKPVIRYFITTTANLRKYLREQKSALPSEYFSTLMELTLPQFVWIIQVASLQDWKLGRANTIWVLDATSSALDEKPFFMLHDKKRAFVSDRGYSTKEGWFDFDDHTFDWVNEFRNNLTYRY